MSIARTRNDNYDLNAILDDIRDGKPYRVISEAHNVSRQVVSRIAIRHGLRRNREPAARPERPCLGCGTRTWAASGLCRPCQDFYPDPVSTDGLDEDEGAWVLHPRRRILVWQEAS